MGKRFAFVHLDMDLYEGTLAALLHFYPLMNEGGIILLHDYRNSAYSANIVKAVEEFLLKHPAVKIEPCAWMTSTGRAETSQVCIRKVSCSR